MEELYKEYGCARKIHRIIDKNLKFDFSKMNLNGYLVLVAILIIVIVFLVETILLF